MVSTYFFASLSMVIGIVLFIGALRRWEWLVDPPAAMFFCYSQSLLKVIGGTEFCRWVTFIEGVLFFAFGAHLIFELA